MWDFYAGLHHQPFSKICFILRSAQRLRSNKYSVPAGGHTGAKPAMSPLSFTRVLLNMGSFDSGKLQISVQVAVKLLCQRLLNPIWV